MSSGKCPNWPEMIQNSQINKYMASAAKKVLNLFLSINLIVNLYMARLITTIMDKSPWDSERVTSILCVSQVMPQKAVQSFYKSMSLPPPHPIQC